MSQQNIARTRNLKIHRLNSNKTLAVAYGLSKGEESNNNNQKENSTTSDSEYCCMELQTVENLRRVSSYSLIFLQVLGNQSVRNFFFFFLKKKKSISERERDIKIN
jgi:hypothetical protein